LNEDIDPESWLVREVYANFGLAVYHGQVLENGITNLILWSGVGDGIYVNVEQINVASDELLSKTMGAARKVVMSRRADIAHLEDELSKAVKLRNFLAHGYFRERAAALVTDDGRHQMLDELKAAILFFTAVDAKLKPLSRELLRARGVEG
jgi:hypothetical protein